MATNQIGIRNSNVIVPYTASTKRSKWLDVGSYISIPLATTPSGRTISSVVFARIQFSSDSSGNWVMSGHIRFTLSDTVTEVSTRIAGVTLYSVSNYNQNVEVFDVGATGFAWADQNAIRCNFNTATSNVTMCFNDIRLASEPTWASLGTTASAVIEGVLPVDVYIPPASAGIAGLVNNAAGNTAGTPILGKTDGQAVASGYVGETYTDVSTALFTTTAANILTKNLSAGIWRIDVSTTFNTGTGSGVTLSISTSSGVHASVASGDFVYVPKESVNTAYGNGYVCSVVKIPSSTLYYVVGQAVGANISSNQTTKAIWTRIA
jgi:hypothetical protein